MNKKSVLVLHSLNGVTWVEWEESDFLNFSI